MQVFEVHPQDLSPDRLDAFYYAPELRRVREGLRALEKKGEITLRKGGDFALIDALSAADAAALRGKVCKYFEIGDVTRDGTIVQHREDYFEKLPTRARLQVRAGDIIFAKNNSSRGTTVLIPKWFDGGLVTTGFIGIRPKDHEEGLLLWGALASDCFKKQVYYLAITASQPEVRESIFQNEMVVPWPATKHNKKSLMDKVKAVQRAKEKLNNALRNAESTATQVFES